MAITFFLSSGFCKICGIMNQASSEIVNKFIWQYNSWLTLTSTAPCFLAPSREICHDTKQHQKCEKCAIPKYLPLLLHTHFILYSHFLSLLTRFFLVVKWKKANQIMYIFCFIWEKCHNKSESIYSPGMRLAPPLFSLPKPLHL